MSASSVVAAMTTRCIGLPPAQQAAERIARRQAPATDRTHQALHLAELLEQAVDVGGRGAAAARDAAPPAGLDELRMLAFLDGHGVDDRLDATQLSIVDGRLRGPGHLAGAGDHLDQLANRPQLLDLLQLAPEVLEAEACLHHVL